MIPIYDLLTYSDNISLDREVTKFVNDQILDVLRMITETSEDINNDQFIQMHIPHGCFRDPNFLVSKKLIEIQEILSDHIIRIGNFSISPVNEYIIYNLISTMIDLINDEQIDPPRVPSALRKNIESCEEYANLEDETGSNNNVVLQCIENPTYYKDILFEDFDFGEDSVNCCFTQFMNYGFNVLRITKDRLTEYLPMLSDDLYDKYNIFLKSRINEENEKLIYDIKKACIALQTRKLYFSAPEDERNSYICDLLKAKGYIVSDQSLIGVSKSRKSPGEIDLNIRKSPDDSWSLYEALNLDYFSSKSNTYWDEHLSKLLDNYNPIGAEFLFLVVYLSCSKDKFQEYRTTYCEYIGKNAPDCYTVDDITYKYEEYEFIAMAKCTYSRCGMPATVYHILVRIGE